MRIGRAAAGVTLAIAGAFLGLAAAPAAGAAPAVTNWYRLPAGQVPKIRTHSTWSSSNWSGYAESGHFTSIYGSWTVPQVGPGMADRSSGWFSSAWVGIDGFADTHLIQTGTEQDYYDGRAFYTAWWEILPKAETTIAEPVSPGDAMSASIIQTAVTIAATKHKKAKVVTDGWIISLRDTTRGWSFTTEQVYKGPGDSAEFIVEAPVVGRSVSSLSDYAFPSGSSRPGDFNRGWVAHSIGGPLSGAGLNFASDAGTLVQGGEQVSTPGAPNPDEDAYNSSYGSRQPRAPTG